MVANIHEGYPLMFHLSQKLSSMATDKDIENTPKYLGYAFNFRITDRNSVNIDHSLFSYCMYAGNPGALWAPLHQAPKQKPINEAMYFDYITIFSINIASTAETRNFQIFAFKKLSRLKYYRAYEHTSPNSVLLQSRHKIFYLIEKWTVKCI